MNPKWTIRSIITSCVDPLALECDLEIVWSHERVSELVGLTHERHHELVGRLLVDLTRRADLLDPPGAHHGDLVRDLHRLFLVVRDDHGRGVRLVVETPEPVPELGAHTGVQGSEGLVEEQNGRVDGQRASETHALSLPTREL